MVIKIVVKNFLSLLKFIVCIIYIFEKVLVKIGYFYFINRI